MTVAGRRPGKPRKTVLRDRAKRRQRRECTLRAVAFDCLEGRALQAGITEYPIPTATSGAQDVTAGPDGALWFTETGANKIGRITTAGVFTEYPIPTAGSQPWGIAAGPFGNNDLWFTEQAGNRIGRITTSGVITEYAVPTAGSKPQGIALGSDGRMWFTEAAANQIGQIKVNNGQIKEFSITTPGSSPYEIASGPDGALWFTESVGNKVGRITTSGTASEYLIPVAASNPEGITAGSDGALWFTQFPGGVSRIGRVTTAGSFTEYPIPGGAPSGARGITSGPDGALWFTEFTRGIINRLTTSGTFTQYTPPVAGQPWGITSGPDGAVWFVDSNANQIGRAPVVDPSLWVSTTGSASVPAAQGGASWTMADAVNFGDPNLALGSGTTNGTFSTLGFNLSNFAASGTPNLNGLDYVSRTVTIGSAHPVTLQPGDLLFSSAIANTYGGVSMVPYDIGLFHPTTPGDYTAGTFSVVLEAPLSTFSLRDFALVETPTVVGGVTLNPGDFLLTAANAAYRSNITRYQVTDAGKGTTTGTASTLIDGLSAGIGFTAQVFGVELVQGNTTVGGVALTPGELLISVDAANTVGANSLSVSPYDVFTLSVTATGVGTSSGTAAMLARGSDVGLSVAGEVYDGLSLASAYSNINAAPVLIGTNDLNAIDEGATGNPGTLVSALLSGHVSDGNFGSPAGIAVTAVDNTNGSWEYTTDGGTTWTAFGAPTTAAALLLAADASTEVRFVPNADWSGAVTNGLTFRAWDQTGGIAGATADTSINGGSTPFSTALASPGITVNFVNDSPNRTAGGVNNLTVAENSGSTALGLGGLAYSPGPGANEATQTLTYTVTAVPAASLGTVVLADDTTVVNASFTYTLAQLQGMRFHTALNAYGGPANFAFRVQDDAGTANGGVDNLNESLTISVTQANQPPTVVTAAAATPNPVTATTTNLSVLGGDDGGEANLTYTWAVTAKPAGAAYPTFSVNTSNAAKATTATFSEAGTYTFGVTITDAGGLSTTSSVNVTVNQALTTIGVSPAAVTLAENQTQAFAAAAYDQFGDALATQPALTWGKVGVGSVNSTGLYTAPATPGSATVTASSGPVSGGAAVTVLNIVHSISVDTMNDGADGDTSSLANLAASKGQDGRVSLREAILASNNTPGLNTINFGIASGAATIKPTSPLPPITNPVVLDGTTQPGYKGSPLIEISGILAGVGANGLTITAGNSTVSNLAINGFGGDGILVTTNGGNLIEGDYIGTSHEGTTAIPNTGYGIDLGSAASNTIGGTTAGAGNLISGNTQGGIRVFGDSYIVSEDNAEVRVDATTGTVLATYSMPGVANDSAVIGPDGSLYVPNYYNNKILHYDAAGKDLPSFGSGQLNEPQDMIFGPDGNLYVGDAIGDIQKFSPSGVSLGTFASGSGLSNTKGMTFGPDGALYVADFNSSQVFRYDSSGNQTTFVKSTNNGGLSGPEDLQFGPDGDLYVTSFSNNRVIRYNGTTGAPAGTFISGGSLNAPYGLRFDASGNLNVASRGSNSIQTYSPTGVLLHTLVSGLSSPAWFSLAPGNGPGDLIQGNVIGMNAGMTAPLANKDGVDVYTSNVTIGGTAPGAGNTIADNSGKAVVIAAGTGSAIEGNSIFANTGPGIDLGNNGVTANTGVENASLPNSGMNFPVFTSANLNGNTLTVAGYVGTAPGQSAFAGARVEVFKADSAPGSHGAGQTYLGFLTADASGDFSGPITVSGLIVGNIITGTATDTSGSTSEFASNVSAASASTSSTTTVASSLNPSVYGQSVTFTATVSGPSGTPTGTATFLDGSTVLATASLSGGVASFATSALGAGTHYITAQYGGSGVYAASTSAVLTQTVKAAALTVSADSPGKIYGAPLPALTYTAAGLVNGDTAASALTGALTTSATAASGVNNYAIAQGSLAANSNYTLYFTAGTLTVTPAALTVTAADTTKSYGAPLPALTYTAAGLVNGDTAANALTGALTTSATAASGVNNYAIAQGTLAADSNYTLYFTAGTLTVTPAALTVTAADTTKSYGAPLPALTYTAAGLVNGDTAANALTGALTTSATAASGVNNYAIAQGTLAADNNYTLNYTAGTLTVTQAALTVTADPAARPYGQPNPAFTSTLSGLVNGDTPASLGGALTYTTLATAASPEGPYRVTPGGLTSADYTITFVAGTLTVDPLTLTVAGATIAPIEGAGFSGVVATFTSPDPRTDPTLYTAVIQWGDGQTSTGVVAFDAAADQFTVSGGHTYAASGPYPLNVSVQGPGSSTAAATGTADVRADVLSAAAVPISTVEGDLFSGPVATFTDLAPAENGGASDFRATIHWGDGATTTAAAVAYDPTTQHYIVSGAHTYVEEGASPFSVEVQGRGADVTVVGASQVADAPLAVTVVPINARERTAFAGAVATFTDADPGSLPSDQSAAIDWGDGHTTAGAVAFDPAAGRYVVSGVHTYEEEAAYSVRVRVVDAGGASGQASGPVKVTPAPIAVRNEPIAATAGVPFAGAVATFTDPAASTDPAAFSAAIDWGDGQSSAGTVRFDPGHGVFLVEGRNTYAVEGVYAVRVTIRDRSEVESVSAGTAVVAAEFVSVVAVPVPPNVGRPFTGALARVTDAAPSPSPSDFSVAIDWGDGTTSPGAVRPDGPGGFLIVGTHTYSGDRNYPVSVTVTASDGARETALVVISIVPPPVPVVVVAAPVATTATGQTSRGPAAVAPIVVPGLPVSVSPAVPGNDVLPAASPLLPGGLPVALPRGALVSIAAPAPPPPSSSAPPHAPGAAAAPANGASSSATTGPAEAALQAALNTAFEFLSPRIASLLAGPSASSDAVAVRSPLAAVVGPGVRQAAPPDGLATRFLWDGLDDLGRQVESGGAEQRAAQIFGTGAVAYVGYVLLNGRWGYLVLSVLSTKPLWGQIDPLGVLLEWEDEKKKARPRGATDGDEGEGEDEDEDETLQTLVEANVDAQEERAGHDETQSGDHQPHYQHPARRARARAHPRPRGRRDQGAKNHL